MDVPTIEQINRFLKEWIWCIQMDMPFKRVPRRFIIEVVKRVTILVNFIPRKGRVYTTMSPKEVITGKKLKVQKYNIGKYVQAYTKTANDTGENVVWMAFT